MTQRRRYRRRVRFYLRFHIGPFGCSIPLFMFAAAIAVLAVLA